MNKGEIIKKVFTNIDKIIENFLEVLLIIKRKDNDLKGLFFAKRRIIDIINIILEVYEELVRLRNIHAIYASQKTPEEEKILFVNFLNKM